MDSTLPKGRLADKYLAEEAKTLTQSARPPSVSKQRAGADIAGGLEG
ncbi:MAG: hypothetical protein OSB21_07905 [Myxococcota bacterium]|nr:hypothetical protein [Myxococcota bacterium]